MPKRLADRTVSKHIHRAQTCGAEGTLKPFTNSSRNLFSSQTTKINMHEITALFPATLNRMPATLLRSVTLSANKRHFSAGSTVKRITVHLCQVLTRIKWITLSKAKTPAHRAWQNNRGAETSGREASDQRGICPVHPGFSPSTRDGSRSASPLLFLQPSRRILAPTAAISH